MSSDLFPGWPEAEVGDWTPTLLIHNKDNREPENTGAVNVDRHEALDKDIEASSGLENGSTISFREHMNLITANRRKKKND